MKEVKLTWQQIDFLLYQLPLLKNELMSNTSRDIIDSIIDRLNEDK